MIQKIYIPTNRKLLSKVNFLSYVELTADDNVDAFQAIFPNATSNLLFSLNEKITLNKELIDSSLYASCSSTIAFRPFVGMKFITVQFTSFGLFYLTGIPAYELQNTLLDLNILFPAADIDRIISKLQEISSIQGKFEELESFIGKYFSLDSIDPRLPYSICALKSNPTLTVDDLSRSLGITSRGLQKIFKQKVGISPAFYRKIIRFNRAANLLLNRPNHSLTQIAYKCDYYDQAHFIKDFKKFGGITPSKFLTLKTDGSDFYNYNLKDIENLAVNY